VPSGIIVEKLRRARWLAQMPLSSVRAGLAQ
jgi:hypothetical protein